MVQSEDALAEELAFLLERAGIDVPPARLAGAVAELAALKAEIALVGAACPPHGEPANVFRVAPARRPA